MVTMSPIAPEAGVTVILDKVVKVTLEERPVASLPFTVWLPLQLSGTVKVALEKLPVTSVAVEPTLLASK